MPGSLARGGSDNSLAGSVTSAGSSSGGATGTGGSPEGPSRETTKERHEQDVRAANYARRHRPRIQPPSRLRACEGLG